MGCALALLACTFAGCDDRLEVRQAYDFSLSSWYLQEGIAPDETVEIRNKLDRDYLYHFAWTGEELFKSHFMVKQYGELRQVIRQVGVPGEVHGYIRHKREECLKELVSGSIRRRSTDDISNLAHTYRLECMQRLVKDYTGFERLLSMKAPREEVKAKTELETMKKKSNGLKM